MSKKHFNTVSIGEAARLTGATTKQIRYWTSSNVIECPEQVKCGQRDFRYFNERDLATIRLIKELLDQGYTLKAASQRAKENSDKEGK